jgi:Iron/zinc purple acid phosphatase-like protein C
MALWCQARLALPTWLSARAALSGLGCERADCVRLSCRADVVIARACHQAWQSAQPSWSLVRSLEFGWGRMTVYNSTHLHYELIPLAPYTDTDDFWLVKPSV